MSSYEIAFHATAVYNVMMHENPILVELVDFPIDVPLMLEQAYRTDCGAILVFLGTTREWTGSEQTAFLEYDAYRAMALDSLRQLAHTALDRWQIKRVAITHRLGIVPLREASVAIVVSSPHRKAAFEAGEWLIDQLKVETPIWKQEHQADSQSRWLHPTSGDPL